MIRIGRSATVTSDGENNLESLRARFNRQNYFLFPNLLEPELLDFVQVQIARGEFYERIHEGIGSNKELCMTQNSAFAALLLLMNDEKLFQIIQDITQCGPIGCFEGRIYRVIPGHGHHDSWHSDMAEHRLVGMSLNLSREHYCGGILQIRERESGKLVSEVANVGVGDAIIFRLSDTLQHRITDVEGEAAKTAFAGWFRAMPGFLSLLKGSGEQKGKNATMKARL